MSRFSCAYLGGVQTGIVARGTFGRSEIPQERVRAFGEQVARTTPEAAARTILGGASRGESLIVVGADAYLVRIARLLQYSANVLSVLRGVAHG